VRRTLDKTLGKMMCLTHRSLKGTRLLSSIRSYIRVFHALAAAETVEPTPLPARCVAPPPRDVRWPAKALLGPGHRDAQDLDSACRPPSGPRALDRPWCKAALPGRNS